MMDLNGGVRGFMEERFFQIARFHALGCVIRIYDKEVALVFRERRRVNAASMYNNVSEVLAIDGRQLSEPWRIAHGVLFCRLPISEILVQGDADFRSVSEVRIENIRILDEWLVGLTFVRHLELLEANVFETIKCTGIILSDE